MNIPKVIYMCHRQMEHMKKYSTVWTSLNPEYTVQLYNDEMCAQFLREQFSPLHEQIFHHIRDGPIKADFWRVCILYKYGGIYVDADIEPLIPFREYMDPRIEFMTCISHFKSSLNPHFIRARAGDSLLEKCIQTYVDYYHQRRMYSYWGWSICSVMKIHLPHFGEKDGIQTVMVDNTPKQCQFLKENYPLGYSSLGSHDHHCVYNGKRVLNNRRKEYDPRSHQFV